MFLIYKNDETTTSYIKHKRFMPNDTHPNFYLAESSFILEMLDEINDKGG
jgi:hypothetical protein